MEVETPKPAAGLNEPGYTEKPLVPNEGADEVRFEIPKQPTFPFGTSLLSVLSLLVLSVFSLLLYLQLVDPGKNLFSWLGGSAGTGPWHDFVSLLRPIPAGSDIATWAWLPFLLTLIGGALGFFFETGLLIAGAPFQTMRNRFAVFVTRLRLLNLAPVVAGIFFFFCAMFIHGASLRTALFFAAVAGAFGMGVAAFFTVATALPLVILGTQVVQLVIVLATDSPVGGHAVAVMLGMVAVAQGVAFVLTTRTPLRSVAFHLLATLSSVLMYASVVLTTEADLGFTQQVAPMISTGSLMWWGVVAAAIAGLVFTMKASPLTYNAWRAALSNAIWSPIYFLLISAKRFPRPVNLSKVYKDGAPEPSKIRPFYQQHPEYLPDVLAVPAVEKIEDSVTALGGVVKKARNAFKLIALLDHVVPQANVHIPLKDKPRLPIWSNGFNVYPQLFLKTIFGFKLPIPELKKTPPPAIDAFKKGQLLAYLGLSGVANPFLKPAPERGKDALVMDFRFLEKYETKPDYESYGGMAYFRVNSETEKLEMVSVVAPHTSEEIKVNPIDTTYRHAESMVLASMYFMVISGKHLAGIHMTYNLLEVVLHNAFDAQGQFNHPFRTFMYLHLFSHELAEELTTEHLVQEGAVFNQIFATSHTGLINHLNDYYHDFEYASDEDFEARKKMVTMTNHHPLPDACITWELRYAEIWQWYTDALMEIIYPREEDVRNDKYLQDVFRGLNEVMLNGVPSRYDDFQTRAGVSRWASDTIHHLVVRHQVYGTAGVRAAMDPRISSPQVPRDRGTPAVDEWRSLICVGLATACSRFTLLLGEDEDKFTYLLNGVQPAACRAPMAKVFEELQARLLLLDEEWTRDEQSKEYNYNYFRSPPSLLRTGAGY